MVRFNILVLTLFTQIVVVKNSITIPVKYFQFSSKFLAAGKCCLKILWGKEKKKDTGDRWITVLHLQTPLVGSEYFLIAIFENTL